MIYVLSFLKTLVVCVCVCLEHVFFLYFHGLSLTFIPITNRSSHSLHDFPGGSDGKSVCLQCGRPGFNPWVGKIPWRRKWQPTPVLLPWKSHGRIWLSNFTFGFHSLHRRVTFFCSGSNIWYFRCNSCVLIPTQWKHDDYSPPPHCS